MSWFHSCKIHQAVIKTSSGESVFSWNILLTQVHVTLIRAIVISHELSLCCMTWTWTLQRPFHVSSPSHMAYLVPMRVCATSLAECVHCYESSCPLLSYWLFSLGPLLLEQLPDVWRPLRHGAPYWLRIMMLWNKKKTKHEWTFSRKCGFFFSYPNVDCSEFQGSSNSWLSWLMGDPELIMLNLDHLWYGQLLVKKICTIFTIWGFLRNSAKGANNQSGWLSALSDVKLG